MPRFSGELIQAAREIAARLDPPAADGLEAARTSLVASVLHDALARERGIARSPDTHLLLDGAMERCRRAAADPARGRDEVALVIAFLLLGDAEPSRATADRPRVRVIQGGMAAVE